jgi:FkbM family methyltransferase
MEKVLIYGVGEFYRKHVEQVKNTYQIIGCVDRTGFLEGKVIPTSVNCFKEEYDYVLIMVINIHACFEITTQLLKENVPYNKIILGLSIWGPFSSFDSIKVTKNGGYLLTKGDMKIQVSTEDEFHSVEEVILMNCYQYHLNGDNKEIVFDVGMNIGDSTLYFLQSAKVAKVYGFEPFRKTYMDAINNLKPYVNSPRLSTYQIGLSDHDEEKNAMFNKDMTCGQSTVDSFNQHAVHNYINWGLVSEKNNETEIIQLRKSSQVFSDIIEKHPNCKYILKMDCEGEEYAIFKDLYQAGVLKKFHFIMMEWHYRGTDVLLNYLNENGFSYFTIQKCFDPDLGLIYAWKENTNGD